MSARRIVRPFSKVFTAVDARLIRTGRGSIGGRIADRPVLLLTTTGRRSGRPRTTPLIYSVVEPATLLLVAANGGADWRPDWLLNIRATPGVEVEVQRKRITAIARVLDAAERENRWADACRRFPGLDAAQDSTHRSIDLVELRLEAAP